MGRRHYVMLVDVSLLHLFSGKKLIMLCSTLGKERKEKTCYRWSTTAKPPNGHQHWQLKENPSPSFYAFPMIA